MSHQDNEDLDSSNQTSTRDDNSSVDDDFSYDDKSPDDTKTDDDTSLSLEELKKKLEETEKVNKRLFERAKKAEGFEKQPDGSWVKKKPESKQGNNQSTINTPQTTSAIAEELRLIAKGLSDEEISEAKSIARGKGISLTEALKDKLFLAYQEVLAEEDRKTKAKLGASKGSVFQKDNTFKSGMSQAEHKALWMKVVGK